MRMSTDIDMSKRNREAHIYSPPTCNR